MERIVRAVMDMDKATMLAELELVFRDFETRHWQTRSIFRQRYAEIEQLLGLDPSPTSDEKKELIGASFCHEYNYAAAALLNPSVVPHPDPSGLRPGCQRLIISLPAVGEGQCSSISSEEAREGERG